jgi:hypothetical protein
MPEWNSAAETGVDDQFLHKYRNLLDLESAAFDELEHAYEDGDRAHFETDLAAWRESLERRATFLRRHGLGPVIVSV